MKNYEFYLGCLNNKDSMVLKTTVIDIACFSVKTLNIILYHIYLFYNNLFFYMYLSLSRDIIRY